MDTTSQRFPLPDFESQKLDQLREQLAAGKIGTTNSWIIFGVVCIAATAAWLFFSKDR